MFETAQRLPYTNSCARNILLLRPEITRRRALLPQLESELEELMSRFPDFDQQGGAARQRNIARLQREIRTLKDEIERLEAMLDDMEKNCNESDAQLRDPQERSALETSLRKTIDDPRYWRDGDPAQGQIVSDGFKRLYPGE